MGLTQRYSMTARGGLLTVAAWVLLSLVGSCGEEVQAPPKPARAAAAASKPAAATPEQPAIEQKPAVTWAYSPVGKRDPFRSYLADLQASRQRGERAKMEETERFELDQYRLTGLITGTAQPLAMVEDPAGKGHVLHIGSRLGKNGGRITRIVKTGIVVAEEFRAPTGERVRVPITINLPKPQLNLLQP